MLRFTLIILAIGIGYPVWAQSREEKVARLIKDMDSSDAKTRAVAAEEVGRIAAIRAALGKPALSPMLRLLKDKDADVRAAAAEALGKIDEPKEVVEPLTKLVKDDPSDKVKMHAAIGLGLVGGEARSAVKTLQETARKAREDNKMQLAQSCQRAVEAINGARKK